MAAHGGFIKYIHGSFIPPHTNGDTRPAKNGIDHCNRKRNSRPTQINKITVNENSHGKATALGEGEEF